MSFTTTKKREAFVKILLTVVRYQNTKRTVPFYPCLRALNTVTEPPSPYKTETVPGKHPLSIPTNPRLFSFQNTSWEWNLQIKIMCVRISSLLETSVALHCVERPHLVDGFLANGPPTCFHFLAIVNNGRPCRCLFFILGSENLLLTDLYGRPLPWDLFSAWQPAFCSEGPECIAPSFKPLPAPITFTGKQKQNQTNKTPKSLHQPRDQDLELRPACLFLLSFCAGQT